ncbi:MAG: TonB-dependent receptor [Pseudomonadota bacterium]
MNKTISAGLIGLLLPLSSYAEDSTKLDDVVVTASRTPQKISDALGDISVITEQDIQRAGQTSLVELLSMQPGIEMAQNGGMGKSSDVYIRGANATHTVVLVDGMRINSATNGTTALQSIPLSQIERVEILRGPASGLYGADAIGGVIQIFTKSANGKPRLNASVGLGTYGTSIADAGISGRISDTSFSLLAGTLSTNGVSAISNPRNSSYNPDSDGYSNKNYSARLAQHFGTNHEIGLSALLSDSENHTDSGTNKRFDYYGSQILSTLQIYSKNRFTDSWVSTLRAGQSRDNLKTYSARSATNAASTYTVFETVQTQYFWQNDITTKAGLFTLGAERREQDLDGTTNFTVKERNIQSYLAGWQAKFGKNSMQANLRNDDNSQFGNKTTGAVSYGYQLTPEWRANASYGTAFAAPTFNQLYTPPSTSFRSNPDLKPEESTNKEVGLYYDNGVHRLGAVYYYNDVDNLIVNTRVRIGAITPLVPINVSQAVLKGLTLTYQGSLAGLQVRASADLQRTEDEATGNLLPRRAKEHGNLAFSKNWGPWAVGTEIEASGSRYNDAANLIPIAGYALVNLYTNYKINNDWSLNARINNLLDKNYELITDYGTYGTNLLVTLRYAPAI